MRKSLYRSGHNEVSGNGEDQISNYGSLEVGQGYNGENSIYGSYDADKKYVENHSGSTVDAVNTWWGEPPVSGMFSGGVDYYAPLTSDPLSGVTHGHDGQAPAKLTDRPASIEDEYERVESLLSRAETVQEVRNRLHRLFLLSFQDDDPTLTSRFSALTRNAAEGQVALQSERKETNKALQDYASVLHAKSLIRDEKYGQASSFLDERNAEELSGYDRRDYYHLKAVTETYHGQYETALATLEDLYAFQSTQEVDMEEFRAGTPPLKKTSGRVWQKRAICWTAKRNNGKLPASRASLAWATTLTRSTPLLPSALACPSAARYRWSSTTCWAARWPP